MISIRMRKIIKITKRICSCVWKNKILSELKVRGTEIPTRITSFIHSDMREILINKVTDKRLKNPTTIRKSMSYQYTDDEI